MRKAPSESKWRFDWLKAVIQDHNLTAISKVIATTLAAEFANDRTRETFPSMEKMASYIGVSLPTVKRAIRALVEAGWLGRTEARGSGHITQYSLLSPGKVVAFVSVKKGVRSDLSKPEKGSTMKAKGVRSEPFHNKEEQYFNNRGGKPQVRPFPNRCAVIPFGSEAEAAWDDWYAENRLPSLSEMGVKSSDANGRGWDALSKYPPNQEDHDEIDRTLRHAAWAYNLMHERQEKSA